MEYKRNCEIKSGMLFPETMKRIALGVEYNGTQFFGFQKQKPSVNTVQAALETGLTSVANENISLVCAGRTDAGVHATCQVVHFDTLMDRPGKAWVQGVNSQLPGGVRVLWSKDVGPDFHARFSASYRCYRYVIYAAPIRSSIMESQVSWNCWELDETEMHSAAIHLQGRHDFTSFRAAQCQAANPIREVKDISVKRRGRFIVLEICANAFLYHMVRNIAGALIDVGRGARPASWMKELLELKDRKRAPAMASPQGLYLVDVGYPPEFGLPASSLGPLFLEVA